MKSTYLLLLILAALLGACSAPSANLSQLPDQVDYNFHIKPILSDRCYACHGPDAQKREAELRFDEPESSLAKLASGNGYAIVPGNSSTSLLTEHILSENPEFMMPPPESNLTLSEHEKALLIKWIDQGAEYKKHWAFSKPEKSKVPDEGEDWAENEIDNFIASRLEQNGIEPSPEAKREHLIRRLFFDITGLPPRASDP